MARLGLAKTAVGTFSWSTGVRLRHSVRASHIASAATGVRLMRLVTSPTAWIDGTLEVEYLSTITAPSAASCTPAGSRPSFAVFGRRPVANITRSVRSIEPRR